MNDAHLHLILVHIPIILVPLGAILLSIGMFKQNITLKLTSFYVFAVASIFAIAAFLLGEGAEEIVEDIAGISESLIEAHEESAEIALWATAILGVLSLINILIQKLNIKFAHQLMIITLIVSIFSSGALAYTGQEGGKIRHPEAFDPSALSSASENHESDD